MSKEKQILEIADILLETTRQESTDKSKNKAYTVFDADTIFKYGCDRLNCATALYDEGYRKQSDIVDEFAKKLKDYPIEVRLPLLGLETKEEIEEYVNKLFDQIESIVDKIAEEMKGGE